MTPGNNLTVIVGGGGAGAAGGSAYGGGGIGNWGGGGGFDKTGGGGSGYCGGAGVSLCSTVAGWGDIPAGSTVSGYSSGIAVGAAMTGGGSGLAIITWPNNPWDDLDESNCTSTNPYTWNADSMRCFENCTAVPKAECGNSYSNANGFCDNTGDVCAEGAGN